MIFITQMHGDKFAVIHDDMFSSHKTIELATQEAHRIAQEVQKDIMDLTEPFNLGD